MRVLSVNAGSTSLKLACVEEDGSVRPIRSFEDSPRDVDAVGHRVVHGGERFTRPALLDDEVLRAVADVSRLAPLHNAPALEAIASARKALPGVPHVAVFDTAFHATLTPEAHTYAVPRRWRDQWGIRRYGFHGLSVEWTAGQIRVPRLVVCHLGGGCSITAVRDGVSVDTTMGLTPLEGPPMATRSGSIDPGALVHLLESKRLTLEELDHALEHESGLLGLSGLSGQVDELERAEADGDEGARLALAVFVRRVAQAIAAMSASIGGLDAVAFTAGIGERSALVRERVCARLAFLGIELDPAANLSAEGNTDITTARSPVRVVVVTAREELVIARAVAQTLAGVR